MIILGQVLYATLTVCGSLCAVRFSLPAVGAAIGLCHLRLGSPDHVPGVSIGAVLSMAELLRSHRHGLLLLSSPVLHTLRRSFLEDEIRRSADSDTCRARVCSRCNRLH